MNREQISSMSQYGAPTIIARISLGLKRSSSSSQKVALPLRVLEGCCLLCRDCAAAVHWYNAVKMHSLPLLP
ncbi:hypothetical protein E2562_035016 [Oryza meyeriana var. granulata]|uniref:Uncharacterized protein n=1 Tax=Oryza meyeriana var. granulata TaxID=110450 RepID=A0A6G1F1R1_9ORYZ|nr:hypothetical protein E2562_035016 [Oryza meyeriana var. granulata]